MKLQGLWRGVLLVCVLLAGCQPPAGPTEAASQTTEPQSEAVVTTVCAALHTLSAQRRGECCGTASTGDLSAVCTLNLSEALKRGAVRVDGANASQCARDMEQQLQGCDWVGTLAPVPPPSCRALVSGSLAAGERCDSSLECNDGLYCRGAGPGVGGACAAPAAVGALCETPSDNLAVALHGLNDPRHPSCDGACVRGQCLARQSEGASCSSSALCQNGLNCVEGQCSAAALAAEGATCSASTPCAQGLVCNNGHCATPAGTGARCSLPFECRSLACVKPEGEVWGQCADACVSPAATSLLPAFQPARLALIAAPDA